MADISKITLPDGNSYNFKDSGAAAIATCSTAAATAAKVITVDDSSWALRAGCIICVKFTYSNTASNVTLNVNGSGAKSIWYNSAVYTSATTTYTGYAGRYIYYMYDGTYWVWLHCAWNPDTNTYTTGYCSTGAGTAAKTCSFTGYALTANAYVPMVINSANTAASALTMNVNSKGAKPIYINGTASSATNYTLPAGFYVAWYDGTNYYFRTDGKLPYVQPATATDAGGIKVGNGLSVTADGTLSVASAIYTATIGTTWSGSAAPYNQTITVTGMLATDAPTVDVTPSSTYATAQSQLDAWGAIYRITTAANSITVYATKKTSVSVPIQLLCVRT